MRLADIFLLCAFMILFNGLTAAVLVPSAKTYRKTKNIEAQYERDKFIQAGFKQICCINDAFLWQQKADEFKRTCMAFWQFDSFALEKKNNLYRAEWQSDGEKMSVYVKK